MLNLLDVKGLREYMTLDQYVDTFKRGNGRPCDVYEVCA
jgi:hypothetical protein